MFVPRDRNQIARILFLAEAMERQSKAPGRRNGLIGYVGMAILRVLALRFLNRGNGRCDPSYTSLQCVTGLCRSSVANGLWRLERAGILRITRRKERAYVMVGRTRILTTIQSTNAYSLFEPSPDAGNLPVPEPRRRPFPWRPSSSDQLSLHCRMEPSQSQIQTGPFLRSWLSFN
jgi:hypothetical protein